MCTRWLRYDLIGAGLDLRGRMMQLLPQLPHCAAARRLGSRRGFVCRVQPKLVIARCCVTAAACLWAPLLFLYPKAEAACRLAVCDAAAVLMSLCLPRAFSSGHCKPPGLFRSPASGAVLPSLC